MRIAFLTESLSSLGGGISVAVTACAGALVRNGHDVLLIGLEDAGETLEADARIQRHQVMARGLLRLGQPARAEQLLTSFRPQVLHTHGLWSVFSRIVPTWARQRGIPWVVSPHGMLDRWALQQSAGKKKLARLWFENRHLGMASAVHVLCEPELQSLRDLRLSVEATVIPNGVDLPERAALSKASSDSSPYLLFLGRIHPKKNLTPLIQAWARLAGAGQPLNAWRLVIAGWEQVGYQQELEALIEELGVPLRIRGQQTSRPEAGETGGVEFAGPAYGEAKDRLLRNASGFVLPSLSEGLPMAILEAWAYGIPVLMTDACNLPEGFEHHAALRLATDPASIAETLVSFCRLEAEDRQSIGARGRALVERHYSWDAVAAQFVQLYQRLATGR